MKPMVSTPRKTIIDQKPNTPISPNDDRPREQERDFEVEDDEQDRDQVEAHVELHARVVEGVEAALVGRQLFRIRVAVGDQMNGATSSATPMTSATPMKITRGR